MPPKRVSQTCVDPFLMPSGNIPPFLSLLGVSMIIALFLMIVIFLGEQFGVMPVLTVILIDTLTIGENYLLFVVVFILGIFLGLITIWVVYRAYRVKVCSE